MSSSYTRTQTQHSNLTFKVVRITAVCKSPHFIPSNEAITSAFIYEETMEMFGIQPQEAQRTGGWYTTVAVQGSRPYGPFQRRHRRVVSEGIRACPLRGAECLFQIPSMKYRYNILSNFADGLQFLLFTSRLVVNMYSGCEKITILAGDWGHVATTAPPFTFLHTQWLRQSSLEEHTHSSGRSSLHFSSFNPPQQTRSNLPYKRTAIQQPNASGTQHTTMLLSSLQRMCHQAVDKEWTWISSTLRNRTFTLVRKELKGRPDLPLLRMPRERSEFASRIIWMIVSTNPFLYLWRLILCLLAVPAEKSTETQKIIDLDVDIGADAVDYKYVISYLLYRLTCRHLTNSAIANQESLSGLETEMRKLEGIVKEITEELGYLERREERFSNTNRTSPSPCSPLHTKR